MAIIHFVARTFHLHPQEVKKTFTLRQALVHIMHEINIARGKITITRPLRKEETERQQQALRAEAAEFFMRHRPENSNAEAI